MWENLQKKKRRSCIVKTINIPAPNAKTKKTDPDNNILLKEGDKRLTEYSFTP